MDEKRIAKAFEEILEAIGENRNREGLEETPIRVAKSYQELFSGIGQDPRKVLQRTFNVKKNDYIIEKQIDFYSMCEHHFLPFFGKIDIAYIPNGKILGFGDLLKLVDILSKRPQIQERLTEEIATYLYEELRCQGVFIRVKAKHLCMTMRGEKKENTEIITVSSNGVFEMDSQKRFEVLQLLNS
ncbi:GTP cyclohydrolase I FolE [Fusobacterium gonidiaformans]|uniref:GTP cyclohydrolase I FolE n=1 Tax=Fusobacterium gonidiaformans TaxID=849 RepID=UPI0023F51060|nr:GTP cyclohydrolase I FolE [Fusobacterium gonidiaformans]